VNEKLAEMALVGLAGCEVIVGIGGPLLARASPAATASAPTRVAKKTVLIAGL
jgi:hypothetical protein